MVVFIPKGVKKGIVEGAAVCRKESKQSRGGGREARGGGGQVRVAVSAAGASDSGTGAL